MKRLEGEDELAPIINLKVPAYLKIVAQRQGRILVQGGGGKGTVIWRPGSSGIYVRGQSTRNQQMSGAVISPI